MSSPVAFYAFVIGAITLAASSAMGIRGGRMIAQGRGLELPRDWWQADMFSHTVALLTVGVPYALLQERLTEWQSQLAHAALVGALLSAIFSVFVRGTATTRTPLVGRLVQAAHVVRLPVGVIPLFHLATPAITGS